MKKLVLICLIAFSSAIAVSSCGTSEAKASYQCPMKCEGEKTYDKAGECPVCKMPMEEVKK